ncbi:MAG: hypothetical protein WCV73_05050 [Patescibacteria group bacterium]|jgi:hypothetical protein
MIANKFQKIISIISVFSLLTFNFLPLTSLAQAVIYQPLDPDFNPNHIISDAFINDYSSLTLEQIREFLNEKGGTLGRYIDPLTMQPAYWLIWNTAQEYRINPKFIMIMLQKEQSLITDPSPTANQYNWAVGYSCYGGICLDKYRGFAKQIQSMARKFIHDYLADLNIKSKYVANFNCTFTKWCVGVAKMTQDDQTIRPENKITAALYTYNPYQGGTLTEQGKIGANYNFWKIWNNWFNQTSIRPTGSLVKANNNDTVYLIQDGKKRPFANFSALATRFNPSKIVIVDQLEIDQYELGEPIKFSQYSLLADSGKNIYLLVDDTLRKISSQEVFRTLGFNPEEVENVADADLAVLKKGREITISSSYPTGALIMDSSSGGVYYVEAGEKFPILAKEILKNNYPDRKILSGRSTELDKYPKGEAIKFKDGSLIKAKDNPIVYVVAGGKKLPIATEEAFISRGYRWADIIETSQVAVDIHPTGEALEAIITAPANKAPIDLIIPKNLSATSSTTTIPINQ